MVGRPRPPLAHDLAWNIAEDVWERQPASDASWEDLDAFTAEVDAINWAKGRLNGAIPIANLGCAVRLVLVVTGSRAGQVWVDDRANDGGLFPAPVEGEGTFTEVYADWLHRAEAQVLRGETLVRGLW